MPVDFYNLPERVTLEPKSPSPIVWAALLVFAVAIGIALILWLWPKDRSPQCWQFYTWMFGVPSVCWAVSLAGRIHVYESTLLQVQSRNAQRAATVNHNTDYARRPLVVVAHALITPLKTQADEQDHEAASDGAESEAGEQKQTTRLTVSARIIAGETSLESKQVRETKEVRAHSDLPRDDHPSTPELLETIGIALTAEMKPQIDRIPLGVQIEVWLDIQDQEATDSALSAWQRAKWQLDRAIAQPRLLAPGESVMALDAWLDDDTPTRHKLVLLLSAQLRDNVPAGSGEAAVALLLGSPELVKSLKLSTSTQVHRPVIGSSNHERSVAATALDWGAARPQEIELLWESGLPKTKPMQDHESTLPPSDHEATKVSIDDALGHTGAASGWLAIALAAEHAAQGNGIQFISTFAEQQPCWLVVRPSVSQSL
jgi:hypothetical protein